jgi:hypothetical protein
MSSIINDALTMLNDLELNFADVAGKLSAVEKQNLMGEIDRVVRELEHSSTDGLTELEFAALANKLIDSVNAYDAVRTTLSADDEIASAQERAAQLAVLEQKEEQSISRGAKPATTDKKAAEQFEFLANQIISQCQIIKKKLDA